MEKRLHHSRYCLKCFALIVGWKCKCKTPSVNFYNHSEELEDYFFLDGSIKLESIAVRGPKRNDDENPETSDNYGQNSPCSPNERTSFLDKVVELLQG